MIFIRPCAEPIPPSAASSSDQGVGFGITERKHSHYFKLCPYSAIDVYRVLELFEVTDPCIQHLTKKALCAGKRGAKDLRQDLQEIIDTAQRKLEMMDEESHASK